MTKEGTLLRAIFKLNLPHFTSKDLVEKLPNALDIYYGSPLKLGASTKPAIIVGRLLQTLLKNPVHDGLRLQGRYVQHVPKTTNGGTCARNFRQWRWRVVDAETGVGGTAPNPLPEMLATVDQFGHIKREPVLAGGIHKAPTIAAYRMIGTWEGDKPIDDAARASYQRHFNGDPDAPAGPTRERPWTRMTRQEQDRWKAYLRSKGPRPRAVGVRDDAWFARMATAGNYRRTGF